MPSALQKILNTACVGLLAIGLIGCKEDVEIKDGALPAKYVGIAKSYSGRYVGKFDQNRAALTISMRGDKPILQYRDDRGRDVLHPSCGSAIGKLESLRVARNNENILVHRAVFGFDPGRCSSEVEGRHLLLKFMSDAKGQKGFEVSMLERSREEWVCDEAKSETVSDENCHWETKHDFLSGRFELAK